MTGLRGFPTLRFPDRRGVATATFVVGCATLVAGCDEKVTPSGTASPSSVPSVVQPVSSAVRPASSAAEKMAEGVPVPAASVQAALNSKGRAPYSGPTGTVAGTVTVKGDEAPELKDVLAKISEPRCQPARDMYGKLFREGMMRSLADALVTVTGYDAYVPAKGLVKNVAAKGCTWGTQTIAVTFGQRLELTNKDGRAYMPTLRRAKQPAIMALIPGGDPIKLYPDKPAFRFYLVDGGHEWMKADVYSLKFPTFDVTDLDGKFRIEGVPVGQVRVHALLPATNVSDGKTVEVKKDEVVEVALEIFFDAAKFEPPKAVKTPPKIR